MKKTKLILTALTTTFLMYGTAAVAQDVTYPYATKMPEPISVKYIGTEGEYLLFKVTLNSDVASKASFKIEDRTEGQLYSVKFNTAYKTQLLKIEKQEYQELDFKLVNGKNVFVKTFKNDTVESGEIVRNDNALLY